MLLEKNGIFFSEDIKFLDSYDCTSLGYLQNVKEKHVPFPSSLLTDILPPIPSTIDFARDNPELIKRMIKEGHTVGNHSYHHYSMDELDTATAKEEITFLHRYMQDNFNYTMSYFRFPKGEFSEKSLAIAQSLGYTSVFWSFAYADWNPDSQMQPDKALAKICESTHSGEIMLLHAVSKTNADILGKVIDDVRSQGYNFTTDL